MVTTDFQKQKSTKLKKKMWKDLVAPSILHEQLEF